MPGRDGTGPMGLGAMTGRGLGVGVGMKPGFGCRRGLAGSFVAPYSKEAEKELLMKQLEILNKRIGEIDK
jgi:hypothetical protein